VSARALRETLASGLPISSRRLQPNDRILAGLESLERGIGLVSPEQADRAYRELTKLDEEPVPGSEILAAGWLHKLSSFEGELMKAFPTGYGQKADLGVYGKYVEKMDELLLKSLEVADVLAGVRQDPAAM